MQLPFRYRRGQTKPWSSIPRIDWSHPLAQGLVSYTYDFSGMYIDLVAGFALTMTPATGTTQKIASSKYGGGTFFQGGNGGDGPFFTAPLTATIGPFFETAPYTFASAFMQAAAVAVGNGCCAWGPVDNGQTEACFLFLDSVPNLYIGFDDGSTQATISSPVLNVFHTGSCSASDASTASVYYDGILNTNFTGVTTVLAGNPNQQIQINNSLVGTNNASGMNGFVYYGAIWRRVLTAAEHLQLHQDPYCFLIYPEDEILANLVGATSAAVLDTLGSQIFRLNRRYY